MHVCGAFGGFRIVPQCNRHCTKQLHEWNDPAEELAVCRKCGNVAACKGFLGPKPVEFSLFLWCQAHQSSSACYWAASWWSCPGWGAGPDWSAIFSTCFQSVWDQGSWSAGSWGRAAAAGSPPTPSSRQSPRRDSFLKHTTEFCVSLSETPKGWLHASWIMRNTAVLTRSEGEKP